MGPHPGFMSDILDGPVDQETGDRTGGINKVFRDANYPEIHHPAPVSLGARHFTAQVGPATERQSAEAEQEAVAAGRDAASGAPLQ